jgi:hypothetical protein
MQAIAEKPLRGGFLLMGSRHSAGLACLLLAHCVDLGIDQEGRYRRVTGPPGEIGRNSAHEA